MSTFSFVEQISSYRFLTKVLIHFLFQFQTRSVSKYHFGTVTIGLNVELYLGKSYLRPKSNVKEWS